MDDLRQITEAPAYRDFAARYAARWQAALRLVDAAGTAVEPADGFPLPDDPPHRTRWRHLLAEVLRWGECAIAEQEPDLLVWAAPVLRNQAILGAVVACLPENRVFPGGAGEPAVDLRAAVRELRHHLEELNLTNASLLAERRTDYRREQDRAYALHDLKADEDASIGAAYLAAEPQLLSAVARDDRGTAVEIINRLLVIAYHRGGYRDGSATGGLDLVKSYLLELVIAMVRTAINAGGAAADLLGVNYRALQELGAIEEEEALSAWLVTILHRIMDALERGDADGAGVQVQAGIDFMQAQYAEPIKRDDAARAAFLSPSYFSRRLKAATGKGFTDLLNQIRIDHAAALLRATDRGIIQVALETGFADQSYFTKVFRKQVGATPRDYRKRYRKDNS